MLGPFPQSKARDFKYTVRECAMRLGGHGLFWTDPDSASSWSPALTHDTGARGDIEGEITWNPNAETMRTPLQVPIAQGEGPVVLWGHVDHCRAAPAADSGLQVRIKSTGADHSNLSVH